MKTILLNLTVIALLITVVASDTPATAYTNHTVGGPAGWSFDAINNISATNYSSWAANQTYNLGDYLSKFLFLSKFISNDFLFPFTSFSFFFFHNFLTIQTVFNTNTNQTVIQTYNETTFSSCTTDDASDDDTFHYNGGGNEFGQNVTIAVPLTTTGTNYFFSDAEDGLQCQRGVAFEISVNRGLGLPPSLNQPPPPPYIEPPGPETSQMTPVNINGGSPEIDNSALRRVANVRFLLSPLLIGVTSLLLAS